MISKCYSGIYIPLTVLLISLVHPLQAQDAGEQARRIAIQATEVMLMNPNASIDDFIAERLAASYAASFSGDELRDHLIACRKAVAGAGGLDLALENDEVHLIFSEGADATVVLRLDDAGKINHLALKEQLDVADMTPEQQENAALRIRVRALESLGGIIDDAALLAFSDEHFSDDYRSVRNESARLTELRDLRSIVAGAGGIQISVGPDGPILQFRGAKSADVSFMLEDEAPYRIATMEVDKEISDEPQGVEIEPITWDNLETRLAEEEEAGFAGAVIVVRDGKVVLHKGYGEADENRSITPQTIFDIGSTPIDFTKAAILKLKDDGKLKRSDTIDRFFDQVPADKLGMTIDHLMRGRSGLPNFHHLPEEDDDYDLSWIDRAEAERRILAQPLLFAPGTGESHSHSAFGLLAAIIERVSGKTYQDYLRDTFFNPIGMERTGFYGEDVRFTDDDMAVGFGQQASKINNPRHWGPTSWLVMGSGGMVSSPGDLYKWLQAMYSGEYLSETAIQLYRHGGILAGGSDRGFLMMYHDNPDQTVIISSNQHIEQGDHASAVARALMRLVMGDRKAQ